MKFEIKIFSLMKTTQDFNKKNYNNMKNYIFYIFCKKTKRNIKWKFS